MPKLIELELRRTRLQPYLMGAAILTAAILGFYLLMGAMPSLSASQGEIMPDADLAMFGAWPGLIHMISIIAMACFSVFSAVLGARFVIADYTGGRAVLLLSYPVPRRRVLRAKCTLTAGLTVLCCLIACVVSLALFVPVALLFGWLGAPTGAILQTAVFMALCMSILSAAIGLISTCIGFAKRSLVAAVVAAVILSSVGSNIFALAASPAVMLLLSVLATAVAAVCYLSLARAVSNMEVL